MPLESAPPMSVTRIAGAQRTHIDLTTVRETLSLIQDDLASTPRHAAIVAALGQAVAAIDVIATKPAKPPAGHLAALFGSRFEPWTPER